MLRYVLFIETLVRVNRIVDIKRPCQHDNMMTEIVTDAMASNDRAFIKVAMELRQLENAIMAGETMSKLHKRLNSVESSYQQNYSSGTGSKTISREWLGTTNCPEPFRSYATYIEGLKSGFPDLEPQLERYRARVVELKVLFDAYCAGENIIMTKLSLVHPDPNESTGK